MRLSRKTPQKTFRSVIAIGALTFLFIWLDAPPTVPSEPTAVPAPPDLQEVASLEELAGWLVGSTSDGQSLGSLAPADLTALLRDQPRTFQLFKSYTDDTTRRELLAGLPYGRDIETVAARHELDGLLLAALVQVESSFLPDAVSPVGAVGLTQVMPSTARFVGARGDLTDPASNLEAGARYLARLLEQFDGDLELSLAAYNAGPGAVRRYGGVPPYRETRQYVEKVLAVYVDHHREAWVNTTHDPVAQLAELHARDVRGTGHALAVTR